MSGISLKTLRKFAEENEMKTLAIECSTHRGQVAIADGGKIVAEKTLSKNAEELIPSVNRMLAEISAEASEIGLIAVSSGPGFFTSLKVGATAAKCFAYALEIPIAAVSSLEILASCAPPLPQKSLVLPVIDARGGMFFWAAFKKNRGEIHRISDDTASPAEQMRESVSLLKSQNREFEPVIVDEGSVSDANTEGLKKISKASACAAAGLCLMKEGKTQNPFSFSPNYLRNDLYA